MDPVVKPTDPTNNINPIKTPDSTQSSSSSTTLILYIVIGILVLVIVCMLLYLRCRVSRPLKSEDKRQDSVFEEPDPALLDQNNVSISEDNSTRDKSSVSGPHIRGINESFNSSNVGHSFSSFNETKLAST